MPELSHRGSQKSRPQRRIQKIQSLRRQILSGRQGHKATAVKQHQLVQLMLTQLRSEMRFGEPR